MFCIVGKLPSACFIRVAFGTNPLSRLRRQLFPFLSPAGDIFPRPGEVFPLRASPWQNQQVSSTPVNGRRSQPINPKTLRPCQSLHLRGRWHFAKRNDGRGFFRDEPSQSPAATAPPKGGALGRTSKFRPHRSTAGRSLPLSSKLFAFAKASPFRERWHGEAVTERVASGTNPLSLAALDSSPERGSPWQNQQVSSSFVNDRTS